MTERKATATRQAGLRRELIEHDDSDHRQSLHARLLQGETKWGTRRYLQAAFNRPAALPWVLVAQSQVGREGLNLHESCRVVVQFHAEWNPAVLEQQIGRVDRKGSLWEERFKQWRAEGGQDPIQFIEVRQLVFEGTYDAFQWDRVMRRSMLSMPACSVPFSSGGVGPRSGRKAGIPDRGSTEFLTFVTPLATRAYEARGGEPGEKAALSRKASLPKNSIFPPQEFLAESRSRL